MNACDVALAPRLAGVQDPVHAVVVIIDVTFESEPPELVQDAVNPLALTDDTPSPDGIPA